MECSICLDEIIETSDILLEPQNKNINFLKRFIFRKKNKNENQIQNPNASVTLECGHNFHRECINQWIKTKQRKKASRRSP